MTERVLWYPPQLKAEVVAMAVVSGDKAAAKHFGLIRRTVSRWRASPEFAHLREQAAASLVDRYAAAEQAALDRVLETIGSARTDHAARALEVLGRNRLLLSGAATSRDARVVEVDPDQLEAWRGTIRAALDELSPDEKLDLANRIDAELERRQLLESGE